MRHRAKSSLDFEGGSVRTVARNRHFYDVPLLIGTLNLSEILAATDQTFKYMLLLYIFCLTIKKCIKSSIVNKGYWEIGSVSFDYNRMRRNYRLVFC